MQIVQIDRTRTASTDPYDGLDGLALAFSDVAGAGDVGFAADFALSMLGGRGPIDAPVRDEQFCRLAAAITQAFGALFADPPTGVSIDDIVAGQAGVMAVVRYLAGRSLPEDRLPDCRCRVAILSYGCRAAQRRDDIANRARKACAPASAVAI